MENRTESLVQKLDDFDQNLRSELKVLHVPASASAFQKKASSIFALSVPMLNHSSTSQEID